jgi:hypothetical protein
MSSILLNAVLFAIPLLLAIGLIAAMISVLRQSFEMSKKWPPIDDDEFIRRCHPGVNRDVAIRVRQIVSEQLGVQYECVYPEQNFVDDLGCG